MQPPKEASGDGRTGRIGGSLDKQSTKSSLGPNRNVCMAV